LAGIRYEQVLTWQLICATTATGTGLSGNAFVYLENATELSTLRVISIISACSSYGHLSCYITSNRGHCSWLLPLHLFKA